MDFHRKSRKQFFRRPLAADVAQPSEPFVSMLRRVGIPQRVPAAFFAGRVMRSNLPPFVVSATAATTYLAFLVQGGEVID